MAWGQVKSSCSKNRIQTSGLPYSSSFWSTDAAGNWVEHARRHTLKGQGGPEAWIVMESVYLGSYADF